MGQLHTIESQLEELGYQILAISPDKPAKLAESIGRHEMKYVLLSDSKMECSRAFGLAYNVDAKTLELYRGYGIDLEDASGETHHVLPVPAVYLVGSDAVIDFEFVNPDYRVRLDADVLLAAARSHRGDESGP